jgi:hypothetical protein
MNNWFKRNFFLFFFGIFAFIGTCMGIAAAWIWIHSAQVAHEGIQSTGTVIELRRSSNDNTVAPVVQFPLKDGGVHTYESSMFSSPPAYDLGEKVTLWYTPGNPDEVVLSGMDRWFLPALFGFFFLTFGGIGYGGLVYQLFKKRDVQWLERHGQMVEATFTGVHYNTSVKMNGASPWLIQCQWLDRTTNKMYVFDSDNIWFDPSTYVTGKTIQVLIDPNNPGRYTVDLSFLPEQAN